MHQMMMTMMMYQNNNENSSNKSNTSNNANIASSYNMPSSNDNSITNTTNTTINVPSSRRDSIGFGSSMDASGLSFTKLLMKDGAEIEDWGSSEMGMTISSDMFSVVGLKSGAPLPHQQQQQQTSTDAAMRVGGGAGLPTTNTIAGGYDGMSPPGTVAAASASAAPLANSLSNRGGGGGGGEGRGASSSIWLQQQQLQQQQVQPLSTSTTSSRTPKSYSIMDENAFNESFKSMDMEDRPSPRKWTPSRTSATAGGGGGNIMRGEQAPRERLPDPDGVMMGDGAAATTTNNARTPSRNKSYRRSTLDSMGSLNLGDLMQPGSGGVLADSSMGNIHNMPSNLDLGISLTSLMSFQSVKSDKNDDGKNSFWLNQYNSIVFEGGSDDPNGNNNDPWEQDEQEAIAAAANDVARGGMPRQQRNEGLGEVD